MVTTVILVAWNVTATDTDRKKTRVIRSVDSAYVLKTLVDVAVINALLIPSISPDVRSAAVAHVVLCLLFKEFV